MYKRPLTDPLEQYRASTVGLYLSTFNHSRGSLSLDAQPYHCVASVLRTPVACAIWGSQLSSSVFVFTTGFKPLNLISAFTHLLARRAPQRTSAPRQLTIHWSHSSRRSALQRARTACADFVLTCHNERLMH